MNNYIKFELALILRTKRLKHALILCVYYLVFTYLLFNGDLVDFALCKIIYFPMLIALPGVFCAQYFSGIEANYVDKLFTIPISISTVLNQKYYLYCLMALIITVLLLPLSLRGITILELFTYFMMGIGPIFFLAFQTSRWTSKKLDLNKSVFLNWQGNNIKQYLFSIILYIAFFLMVVGVSYILPPEELHICMLVFSFIFVLTHRIWLSVLARYYVKNKYKKIRIGDEN